MKIVFLLPTGFVEWQVPQVEGGFSFPLFVGKIRADGFFMSENLYMRHDQLVGISCVADDAPPPVIVRRDLN